MGPWGGTPGSVQLGHGPSQALRSLDPMRLIVLCTSGPTDPSPIDADSPTDLLRATEAHEPETFPFHAVHLRHPTHRTPGSSNNPCSIHPSCPVCPRPSTAGTPSVWLSVQLTPNTHHVPYGPDLDLGVLYTLYTTCNPKTPCPTHARLYRASMCPVQLGP